MAATSQLAGLNLRSMMVEVRSVPGTLTIRRTSAWGPSRCPGRISSHSSAVLAGLLRRTNKEPDPQVKKSLWFRPPTAPSEGTLQRTGKDSATATRASGDSDVPAFKGFPPMQTKPAWYWRIAAVAPYFLPLLEGWLYSETAMTLYPPLFHYKVLCSPIVNVFAILPSWFLLAYFFTAYLGVVRNNRWPHFLRFHVVMGMLMEIILQVVGTLNDWIPASVVWGRFGSHFWLGATLAYIFIVLECILSALKGMYADVPFVSDAAYLQIPYE